MSNTLYQGAFWQDTLLQTYRRYQLLVISMFIVILGALISNNSTGNPLIITLIIYTLSTYNLQVVIEDRMTRQSFWNQIILLSENEIAKDTYQDEVTHPFTSFQYFKRLDQNARYKYLDDRYSILEDIRSHGGYACSNVDYNNRGRLNLVLYLLFFLAWIYAFYIWFVGSSIYAEKDWLIELYEYSSGIYRRGVPVFGNW